MLLWPRAEPHRSRREFAPLPFTTRPMFVQQSSTKRSTVLNEFQISSDLYVALAHGNDMFLVEAIVVFIGTPVCLVSELACLGSK